MKTLIKYTEVKVQSRYTEEVYKDFLEKQSFDNYENAEKAWDNLSFKFKAVDCTEAERKVIEKPYILYLEAGNSIKLEEGDRLVQVVFTYFDAVKDSMIIDCSNVFKQYPPSKEEKEQWKAHFIRENDERIKRAYQEKKKEPKKRFQIFK